MKRQSYLILVNVRYKYMRIKRETDRKRKESVTERKRCVYWNIYICIYIYMHVKGWDDSRLTYLYSDAVRSPLRAVTVAVCGQ